MKRKLLIFSLIFIYTFTCLNVNMLYALHDLFHDHSEFVITDNENDHKGLCEENCTVLKFINHTEGSNSSNGIIILVENLSLHLLVNLTIPIPDHSEIFLFHKIINPLQLYLTGLTPPPKYIS